MTPENLPDENEKPNRLRGAAVSLLGIVAFGTSIEAVTGGGIGQQLTDSTLAHLGVKYLSLPQNMSGHFSMAATLLLSWTTGLGLLSAIPQQRVASSVRKIEALFTRAKDHLAQVKAKKATQIHAPLTTDDLIRASFGAMMLGASIDGLCHFKISDTLNTPFVQHTFQNTGINPQLDGQLILAGLSIIAFHAYRKVSPAIRRKHQDTPTPT